LTKKKDEAKLESVREGSAIDALEVVTEICLLFGWTDEHALSIPARRFFAMLQSGRKMKSKERLHLLADLTDIASIPIYTPEFSKQLREHYLKSAHPEYQFTKGIVMDAAGPEAGAILADIFRQKKRVEGHGI
jgi:hypothetical protein